MDDLYNPNFLEHVHGSQSDYLDKVYEKLENGADSAARNGFQSLIENRRYSGAAAFLHHMDMRFDLKLAKEV